MIPKWHVDHVLNPFKKGHFVLEVRDFRHSEHLPRLYLMVKQHKALAPSRCQEGSGIASHAITKCAQRVPRWRRFMCGAEQQGHEIIVFVKKAWNMDLAPVKEEADWEACLAFTPQLCVTPGFVGALVRSFPRQHVRSLPGPKVRKATV